MREKRATPGREGTRAKTAGWIAVTAVCATFLAGTAFAGVDFGSRTEQSLRAQSEVLFGVAKPLPSSSPLQVDAETADANPLRLVTLARGLRASVVVSAPEVGENIDMIALWPDDLNPTHLIACNEQDPADPGVQRIDLASGAVATILSGMDSCDPTHRTPWGTIVVGEEASDGSLLEIIRPLDTTGVTYDRATHSFTDTVGSDDSANLAVRSAVGHLAFEGVGIYQNGVLYYGDEQRPFEGAPGGAYFKFVPAVPWVGGDAITDLAQSPLTSGKVYGLRLGLREEATDYGQGSETGLGVWVEVPADYVDGGAGTLGDYAEVASLTGYYRPEDLAIDRKAEAADQVRLCGNNTGNEEADHNWGNTICLTDGALTAATDLSAIPEVQLLVLGHPELAMMDNITYQPRRGNWILHEDGDQLTGNNDLWSCLDDGADVDVTSDGCIRIATLNDFEAEWTGGVFDADGSSFFVSLQHNITGHGIVLEITGWR